MEVNIISQLNTLLFCIVLGVKIAFVYDIVRAFRMIIRHNIIAISIEDVLYWFFVDAFILDTVTSYEGYNIRLFMIIGVVVGAFSYLGTIGFLIKNAINHIKNNVKKRIKAKERVEK